MVLSLDECNTASLTTSNLHFLQLKVHQGIPQRHQNCRNKEQKTLIKACSILIIILLVRINRVLFK